MCRTNGVGGGVAAGSDGAYGRVWSGAGADEVGGAIETWDGVDTDGLVRRDALRPMQMSAVRNLGEAGYPLLSFARREQRIGLNLLGQCPGSGGWRDLLGGGPIGSGTVVWSAGAQSRFPFLDSPRADGEFGCARGGGGCGGAHDAGTCWRSLRS